MSLSRRAARSGRSFIRRHGGTGTLRRVTTTPDPATHTVNTVNTDYTVRFAFHRQIIENRDGTIAKTEHQLVSIAATLPAGVAPQVDDLLIVGSTSYRILTVDAAQADGSTVAYWTLEVAR